CQFMAHVLDLVDVVIAPAISAVGQRIEYGVAGLRCWLHQVEDVAHGNATPFGDAGPALDAEMRRDLLLLGHRLEVSQGKLAGHLDETVDTEAVASKVFR